MRRLLVVLGVLVLGLGATVVAVVVRPRAEPLRLGINAWPGYEALVLAKELGYFDEVGVEVAVVEYASLSDIASGYAHGDIDIMACTLNELVIVRDRSPREPRIVLVTDYSNGGDQLFAAPDVAGLADLKGRRIGVEVASLGTYILHRALERAGLALSEVEIIPCDQGAMAEAMRRGDIAAAISYPPYSKAIQATGARRLFSSADIPGEVIDIVAIEGGLLDARPELAHHLRAVWDRTQAWIAEHPDLAHQRMARRLGMTGDEFTVALSGLITLSSSESDQVLARDGSAPAAIAVTTEVLQQMGYVDGIDMSGAVHHGE